MTIKGLSRLADKLKKLPKSVRSEIKQALAEGADQMVATMKNLAPVSPAGSHGMPSGMLKDSIQATFGDGSVPKYAAFQGRRGKRAIKSNDPDLSVTISAGNDFVRYAHLVEFGTKPHAQGGKFKGTQHPGTSAKPFFFPGYRANKKQVKSRISRAITRAAKRVAAGG